MGRRKGELTQLMEVASKWPWWLSAALVLVSYGVFHLIAAAFAQVIVPSNPAANLSWREFETLVGEGFRYRGYKVSDRGGAAPDGGIDLQLARGRERFLVQCKQWRAQQVGVSVVRELYGVMAAERVAGGYVVTSGTFTKDARQFASGRNIELIDGQGLGALLRDGQDAVLRGRWSRLALT